MPRVKTSHSNPMLHTRQKTPPQGALYMQSYPDIQLDEDISSNNNPLSLLIPPKGNTQPQSKRKSKKGDPARQEVQPRKANGKASHLDTKEYATEEEGNQRYAVVTLNQMAQMGSAQESSRVLSSVAERK